MQLTDARSLERQQLGREVDAINGYKWGACRSTASVMAFKVVEGRSLFYSFKADASAAA
jgi:hypothetical protein